MQPNNPRTLLLPSYTSWSHCRQKIFLTLLCKLWDLFLLASSFNLFLLTSDNHFSKILVCGYRISGLIKDVISVSHSPCCFRLISDKRGYECLYFAILKIKSSWFRVLKQHKWASRAEAYMKQTHYIKSTNYLRKMIPNSNMNNSFDLQIMYRAKTTE